MAKPKNIEELRDQLLDAYEAVKNDPCETGQVKAMSNAAGKVLASLKLQLEYAMLRDEIPNIEFLGGEHTPMEKKYLKFKRESIPEKTEEES